MGSQWHPLMGNLQHYLIALWRSLYSITPARSSSGRNCYSHFTVRELISIDFNKSLHWNGRRQIQIEGFSLQIPAFHSHLPTPLQDYVYLRLGLSTGMILSAWGWGDYDHSNAHIRGLWGVTGTIDVRADCRATMPRKEMQYFILFKFLPSHLLFKCILNSDFPSYLFPARLCLLSE